MAWRSPRKFQGVLQSDAGVLTQGGIFVTNGVPYNAGTADISKANFTSNKGNTKAVMWLDQATIMHWCYYKYYRESYKLHHHNLLYGE